MTTRSTGHQATSVERCIASGAGRTVRIALGLGLIAAGTLLVRPPAGWALAAFGLVPFVTGAFNLCPAAPLWGGHFLGSRYCRAQQEGNSGE